MSVETENWRRCGNTDYYRRQWGMLPLPDAWHYVNPFNWSYINCWPQDPHGPREGLTAVIHQKAPRYDWDAIKHGVTLIEEDKDERQRILRATHEWANDLLKVKQMGLSKADARRLWKGPEEIQAYALEGVRALLIGFENLALQQNLPTPAESRATLVVRKGSAADANMDQILEEFHDLKRAILTSDPEQGFQEALADYGILEC